jgi:hypothetical protein
MSYFRRLVFGRRNYIWLTKLSGFGVVDAKPFKKENPWAMLKLEALTLKFEREDSADEHGSFFLEKLQEPCSFNATPESGTLCAPSTRKDCNHLKVLSCKIFRRLVVDAFVYHKHCKFRGCNVALTLH